MTETLGVLIATETMNASALCAFAQRLEARGYESLWLPELFGREPVATAGYLLGQTDQLKVATGIANIYLRDAHAMVQTRRTLAELSGGRFMLGLGVSNPGLNATRGHEWRPPLSKLRDYLDAMDNATIDSPPPQAAAPLFVAAHGPKLQALGAQRTDGVITYLMPPVHTQQTRARVGADTQVSVVSPFLAETDPTVARARARKALKYYLTLDYYHREWQKLGFDEADFAQGGSDRLIDTLVGWGSETQLRDRLGAYLDAGASRVIVMPFDSLDSWGSGSTSGSEPTSLDLLAPIAAS
jgi:probable F420-dependent oxidoreductase